MISPREVFDIVKKHLLEQGERATNTSGACKYRGDSNVTLGKKTSCAVGCLITDEAYSTEAEGLSVGCTKVKLMLQDSGVDVTSACMLQTLYELQILHDSLPVDSWETSLHDLELELSRHYPTAFV